MTPLSIIKAQFMSTCISRIYSLFYIL